MTRIVERIIQAIVALSLLLIVSLFFLLMYPFVLLERMMKWSDVD